jgi:hypothetical protein
VGLAVQRNDASPRLAVTLSPLGACGVGGIGRAVAVPV